MTNQGAIGAEAAMSGGELTVSSGPETSVAGALIGRSVASKGSGTINLSGFGTAGRIPKFSSGIFLVNSVIFEDLNGRIGIGTTTPGSALTVAGQIETKNGGIKFPDGTVQTTSAAGALFQVSHDATLAGLGTPASPLSIANGGVTGPKIAAGQVVKSLNGLFDNINLTAGSNITITPAGNNLNIAAPNLLSSVAHDSTLIGNGTGAMPLGVAVPLNLSGSTGFGTQILEVVNNGTGGEGVRGVGGASDLSFAGLGVVGVGGASSLTFAGDGVRGLGGASNIGIAGVGVRGVGGNGFSFGGRGMIAVGGNGDDGDGGDGIVAIGGSGGANNGLAGRFGGDVMVTGNMNVQGTLFKGGGAFKIDHPLDPTNKYLSHSFVESPDMKNVYDGNITTDQNGEATVTLPDYFEALNRDFRYQLTVIGQFAQAIVASEISGNQFTIKTDRPGVKVSWQVTGIRQDAYANKHRIKVEEEKPERERGYYLHPEVFDQPEEKSLEWARRPEMMREIKSRRQEAELRRRAKENAR